MMVGKNGQPLVTEMGYCMALFLYVLFFVFLFVVVVVVVFVVVVFVLLCYFVNTTNRVG